jgi:hypothetical protein
MTLSSSKNLVPHCAMCERIMAAVYSVYQCHNLEHIRVITEFTLLLPVWNMFGEPRRLVRPENSHTYSVRMFCGHVLYFIVIHVRVSHDGKYFIVLN